MEGLTKGLTCTIVLAVFCSPGFASTDYVLVNNGNYISNSATLYQLDRKTGELTQTAVLETGGQGQTDSPAVDQIEEAIAPDARCIFVLDDGSSDIAAFSKATGYRRVGSYFKTNLISNGFGGSLALTPDGKFLYGSYSITANIGAWRVRSDCKLQFLSAYDQGEVGQIAVSPNGKYLVASGEGIGASLWGIAKSGGALTFLGGVSFRTGACSGGCYPAGVAITKDSRLAVFSSVGQDVRRQHPLPVAISTKITSQGLMNPRIWKLKNTAGLFSAVFPFFDAAGFAGSGNLYIGVWADGGPPGVLTTHFTEHPLSFMVTNATVVDPQVGNIAVTGNVMVIAQYPNQIGVFRVLKDGSLKLLTTTTIDDQGEGMFSLSIFPNTR
jgi:WD40 repeat protein